MHQYHASQQASRPCPAGGGTGRLAVAWHAWSRTLTMRQGIRTRAVWDASTRRARPKPPPARHPLADGGPLLCSCLYHQTACGTPRTPSPRRGGVCTRPYRRECAIRPYFPSHIAPQVFLRSIGRRGHCSCRQEPAVFPYPETHRDDGRAMFVTQCQFRMDTGKHHHAHGVSSHVPSPTAITVHSEAYRES